MNNRPPQTPPMKVALIVWGFGAAFYLLAFFHRVAPAVITNDLMREFQISATSLGNLSAFYFYSYVAMQIPTGILADIWGPRRLLTAGSLIAAVGAATFALAPTIFEASIGRLLIGGSVAVAFVGLLKLSSCWFAQNRFALLSGLALFVGVVGAVFAGTPLRMMVDFIGWRNTTLLSSAVTLLVALGTWFIVRDYPENKGYENFAHAKPSVSSGGYLLILPNLKKVFSYRNTILLFLVPGGIVGCILTFSGLWGVPYLITLYNLSPREGGALASILMVSWAVGGPCFGYLSDRLANRKKVYLAGGIISLIGWILIIFLQNLGLPQLIAIFIVTGFSSGSMVLTFAFVKESVPQQLAGTVSGVINMGVMTGPMILQPAIGWILDKSWAGEMVEGARIYSPQAYQSGFSLMLGWLVLSLILLLFTKETHCKQLQSANQLA